MSGVIGQLAVECVILDLVIFEGIQYLCFFLGGGGGGVGFFDFYLSEICKGI